MARLLYFVTGNRNKLAELEHFIAQEPGLGEKIKVESVKIDLPELQAGPAELIDAKLCEAIKNVKGGAVLVDDTALCLHALNGLPGVYIKHFIDKIGGPGIERMLSAFSNKKCTAECHLGFCDTDGVKKHIIGSCEGLIVPARGEGGFGFDPVFQEHSTGQTFAEMSLEAKNKVSHRANALQQLVRLLAAKE